MAAGDGGVRVAMHGYGSFSPPGAVEIPGKTFHVAIPLYGVPHLAAYVLEEEVLGDLQLSRVPGERLLRGENDFPRTEIFYPPDPWADTGMPPMVSAGRPCFMGRQRVLPVKVNPLILGRGGARLVRRLSVTVNIVGGAVVRDVEPSLAPPPWGVWDRLYRDLLVNPDDVSRFVKPLRPRRAVRRPYDETKRFKILVPETGIYAMRADSLIASGFSPGLSTDGFALKKFYYDESEPGLAREVDIPMLVIEENSPGDGIFGGEDLLIFSALGIKDDADAGDIDAAFTDDNVIWLEEGVAGEIMQEDSLPPPASWDSVTVPFRAVCKVRKDIYYLKNAKVGSSDFYFINGMVESEAVIPFVIHNPAGSGEFFSLSVRIQGVKNVGSPQNLTFAVRNSSATYDLGSGSISSREEATFNFDDKPNERLVDGENELVIGSDVPYGFLVNDFTVTYKGLLVAHDDMLEFSISNFVGTKAAKITGFNADSGVLIEVTDPANPIFYVLSQDYFHQDTLILNLTAPTERSFIALGEGAGGHIPNNRILKDKSSHLRDESGPFNTLIVSHRDFIDTMAVYSSWRKNQGYRILTADAEDVYDEFNGGLPSCSAIKRFIKYGVDHWGVEFVLLVGDSNEERKRVFKKTPQDFVPTYTYCMDVLGEYDNEVVASDKWYTFLDDDTLDRYMDVFLGRFPVGIEVELRAMLFKLRNFEKPGLHDTWRRRVILFADDAWSGRLNQYRYDDGEERFEWSMDLTGTGIESALPGGFDIKRLFLSRWTDGAHPNKSEYGAEVYSRANDSTRTYFTPFLADRLNEGCLFFSFQGHANRSTLTTEAGFATFQQYDDLNRLNAYNMPHIFIGLGCHLSDFARMSELSRMYDGPNGDCFSEQILFKPGAAAVGAYASTAYEYLGENAVFCERIHEVIFQGPPIDSVPPRKEYTGAHWVLGSLLAKAELQQIHNTPSFGYDQVLRYLLLGDPMLNIDPGPPLMRLEANWGAGWKEVSCDSLRARNGTNECTLRFTASDVVALGEVTLEVGGEPCSLTITKLNDQGETFARAYRADVDYTIRLGDELLVFEVKTPGGREAGILEIPIETNIRLFYNDYLEILPMGESPPTGTFRIEVDFPAYLSQKPVLLLNGHELEDAHFAVDPQDSLHWKAEFPMSFHSGMQFLTVKVGEYSKDFVFTVIGNEFVLNAFNFPNPFQEGTNIVYALNLPADAGRIDIFNVSGRLVRTLAIQRSQLDAARYPKPHSIYWDGRDLAGDRVANGTYIYVVQMERGGASFNFKGKSVKLE